MTFKKIFQGHKHSFKYRDSQSSTTLSSHVWNLKDQSKNFNLKWEVVDKANTFNPISKKCRLCLKEKYHILFHPDGASLNRRSELFSTCRHRLRQLLENTWSSHLISLRSRTLCLFHYFVIVWLSLKIVISMSYETNLYDQ